MEDHNNKTVNEEKLHEVARRLREKVRKGNFTPDDLDEYSNACKKQMFTKQDLRAGCDRIDLRLKKLLDIASRWGESTSTQDNADQQHAELSLSEG